MIDQPIHCVVKEADAARPLHAIRPDGLAALLDTLPPPASAYLRDAEFKASAGELVLLPGSDGVVGAAFGLGDDRSPFPFGALPYRLPEHTTWSLAPGPFQEADAILGFCLGAYRYAALKKPERAAARLATQSDVTAPLSQAAAIWMARDLINAPANLLGPAELADIAAELGERYGAEVIVSEGAALEEAYPTIAAVGAGSERAPKVVAFHWRGSNAHEAAPLISLCGKGVCFDTGGYDLKPSAGMLRMKKDMGGAATVLGLARMIMDADLPVRLAVRVGCVENSVSGTAMRPLDVLRTSSGRTVEVGNTDAEGRLVLCDLLDDAVHEQPSLLIDCATLTGAARVALGPDLPALFSNDDEWADRVMRFGIAVHDPVWRLPLWAEYDSWLTSPIADMNNVSSKPYAGAIIGGLFLQRFVPSTTPWLHFDLYAWNDQTRPGKPEGGEAMALRGIFAAIRETYRA